MSQIKPTRHGRNAREKLNFHYESLDRTQKERSQICRLVLHFGSRRAPIHASAERAPDLISRLHLIVSKACMALRLRHVTTFIAGKHVALKTIRPSRKERRKRSLLGGTLLEFKNSVVTSLASGVRAAFQRLEKLGSVLRFAHVTDSKKNST